MQMDRTSSFIILGNLLRKINFFTQLNNSIPISSERKKVIILTDKKGKEEKGKEEGRERGGEGGR